MKKEEAREKIKELVKRFKDGIMRKEDRTAD